MREIKLLLDDDVEFVVMRARVLDEEGFTTKEIHRIFSVSKDVFDMREKEEDKTKWKQPLKVKESVE